MTKYREIILVLATLCIGALLYILSYETSRIENERVQLLFAAMFGIYAGLIFLMKKKSWKTRIGSLFIAGVVLRVILLFSTPNLSDDFYRFTWDGYLTNAGYSPFEDTPKDFLEKHSEDSVLSNLFHAKSENFTSGMNSKEYYSIYPSVNQAIFQLAYWVSGSPNSGNLMVMKAILLVFEIISFFVLIRLLRLYKKSEFLAMLYWLNPLVIVEFVGNLHFDGIALSFLLISFYFLKRQKLYTSGIALAGAISTKLNPLFLACVNWRGLKMNRLFLWWIVTGISSVVLLSVFLSIGDLANFYASFRLYFFVFQFNSSLIAMISELFGYEGLKLAMAALPIMTIVGILGLNLLRKNWDTAEKLMLAYTVYYLFGTTVHPWYIIVLIPFAILSDWKFPLIWSYTIVWTYSFYHPDSVDQNGWIVFLEYLIVGSFLVVDIRKKMMTKQLVS